MVRRIFAIVLLVLGLGTIGAAIASGTVWRPDEQVTLTLPQDPDVPLVVTAPGVLDAVADDVEITLVGATPDTPLVLAMADERDVDAWVGDAPHWVVTGLTDWETLTVDDAAADGEGGDVPSPAGSDLWVEEVTGTGEISYSWSAVPGRWVMLAATDGTEPAPQVQLTWDREVTTPFVQPGLILGGVLTLVGLGLLVVQLLVDRERRVSARARTAAADTPAVTTGSLPVVDGDRPLTRRELRLAQQRGGGEAPSSAPDRTESIPVVEAPEPAGTDPAALDDWVRSGSASPLPQEVDRVSPADLDPETLEPRAATEPDPEPEPEREPWWRRRRAALAEEPAAVEEPAAPEEPVAPEEPTAPEETETPAPSAADPVSETAEIPAVVPDEENDSARSSGASWRTAWGLGPVTPPQERPDEEEQR